MMKRFISARPRRIEGISSMCSVVVLLPGLVDSIVTGLGSFPQGQNDPTFWPQFCLLSPCKQEMISGVSNQPYRLQPPTTVGCIACEVMDGSHSCAIRISAGSFHCVIMTSRPSLILIVWHVKFLLRLDRGEIYHEASEVSERVHGCSFSAFARAPRCV